MIFSGVSIRTRRDAAKSTIFNRSHYEDVLITRVHKLIDKATWTARYENIRDFEALLAKNGTTILKFFLHISKNEQLSRFAQRLDDPARNWKISESDYTERALWDDYIEAFEDAIQATSTKEAPWYVIPSNQKWFRNLAVSQIMADTMEELKLAYPPPSVDLAAIRRKYHAAVRQEKAQQKRTDNASGRRAVSKNPPAMMRKGPLDPGAAAVRRENAVRRCAYSHVAQTQFPRDAA